MNDQNYGCMVETVLREISCTRLIYRGSQGQNGVHHKMPDPWKVYQPLRFFKVTERTCRVLMHFCIVTFVRPERFQKEKR